MYCKHGKRLFALMIVFNSAIFMMPLLCAVALLVRWKLGSPVLFRQKRPGLNGESFELLKFRTMTDERNEEGTLLPDEDRLTPFGAWLRSTSLDELPELFNILRGEMALVGPRPLLMQYLELYTPEQMRRHEVRPGLTGWAQVNGRVELEFEERFKLDVWYVDHLSFWNDLKILWMTVVQVLKREGISQEGYASGPVFRGTHSTTTLTHYQ